MRFEGKFLAVFVGKLGRQLSMWTFQDSDWVKVEYLKVKTLFMSHVTSFSATTGKKKMENKIFFLRFVEDYGVFFFSSDAYL